MSKLYLTNDVRAHDFEEFKEYLNTIGISIKIPLDVFVVLGAPTADFLVCDGRVKVLTYDKYIEGKPILVVAYFNSHDCAYDVVYVGDANGALYYMKDEKSPLSPMKELVAHHVFEDVALEDIPEYVICIKDTPSFIDSSIPIGCGPLGNLIKAAIPKVLNDDMKVGPEYVPDCVQYSEIYYCNKEGNPICCTILDAPTTSTAPNSTDILEDILRLHQDVYAQASIAKTDYSVQEIMQNGNLTIDEELFNQIADYYTRQVEAGTSAPIAMTGCDVIPNGLLYYLEFVDGVVFTFIQEHGSGTPVRLIDVSMKQNNPYYGLVSNLRSQY